MWQETGQGTPITLHNVSWYSSVRNGETHTGGDPRNQQIRIDSIKPRGPTPLFSIIETATVNAMQALAKDLGVEVTTRSIGPVYLSTVKKMLEQRVPITDPRNNNRVDYKWGVIRCSIIHSILLPLLLAHGVPWVPLLLVQSVPFVPPLCVSCWETQWRLVFSFADILQAVLQQSVLQAHVLRAVLQGLQALHMLQML